MRRIVISAVLALLCVGVSQAQQTVEQHPGYFALESLDVFASGKITVDVDLKDAMIKVAAAAASQQDPALADLLDSVRRIRVRIGTLASEDQAEVHAAVDRAVANLKDAGWAPMATITDDDQVVYILSKATSDRVQGLTAFVHDDDNELVLVNIAGDMDPVMIGQLISKLGGLEDFELPFDDG